MIELTQVNHVEKGEEIRDMIFEEEPRFTLFRFVHDYKGAQLSSICKHLPFKLLICFPTFLLATFSSTIVLALLTCSADILLSTEFESTRHDFLLALQKGNGFCPLAARATDRCGD
jgi:hypothetical protein